MVGQKVKVGEGAGYATDGMTRRFFTLVRSENGDVSPPDVRAEH